MRDARGEQLRTVWVLGAGFSRSLGAPLLPDLFREQHLSDLKARYPSKPYGDLADLCWRTQGLFNRGKIERQWIDAEQFIDFVEFAERDSPEASLLLRMSRDARPRPSSDNEHAAPVGLGMRFEGLDSIKSAVLRALAAECSWFSRGALVQTERWDPYRVWLASLHGDSQKIVSFNYDEVLERLSDGKSARVLLPNEDRRNDTVGIYKLHGSVTWVREGGGCKSVDIETALASSQIALGVPGRSKRMLRDELFKSLWDRAAVAMQQAEAIIFLGYRFPETDNDARKLLLDAIWKNSSRRLRIHIVLGPNANQTDALRMKSLIEINTRNRRPYGDVGGTSTEKTVELRVESLGAEDFIALYADDGPLSSYGS